MHTSSTMERNYSLLKVITLILHLVDFSIVVAQTDVRVELKAPRFVIHNHSVTLHCDHDVEPDLVYKVDYLRSGTKIFQYVRERTPPYQKYNITGAKISTKTATPHSITLESMDFSAAGIYSCEVVLETPIFTKASNDHHIAVIQPQRHRPRIIPTQHTFSGNDVLKATCTSAMAHPAPHLTWLINGEKVDESFTKPYGVTNYSREFRLASTQTQLLYPLEKLKLKPDETMELTCISTIPVYLGANPQFADVKNHTLSVKVVQSQPPPQPTQLPVRVTLMRTAASSAARDTALALNALLLLMQLVCRTAVK